MLRILFISLIFLLLGYFFLQGRSNEISGEKPVFLRSDEIALKHHTKINTWVHSTYRPDSTQLETLKADYSNIWAHLNHLYATNDVEAGKEYFTEAWFKQITNHYTGSQQTMLARSDEQHDLHILNWSSDALVCTAIDSNIVLKTIYPDKKNQQTKANVAVVLLFQGDHWRIDALRVLDEPILHSEINSAKWK